MKSKNYWKKSGLLFLKYLIYFNYILLSIETLDLNICLVYGMLQKYLVYIYI